MMAVYGPNEPDSRVLEGAAAELRKKRARTALGSNHTASVEYAEE
jgi:hypothetical protein